MDWELLGTCALIIVARIVDVSLGTLRTVFIVHGRKGIAFLLGFFEVLIWVLVISSIIQNLQGPLYVISYSLGFALGTYIGVALEGFFAAGNQMIRIFTKEGATMAAELRERGFTVTQFEGTGHEGPVSMLFLEARRRKTPEVLRFVTETEPACFYIVDDVRLSSGRKVMFHAPTGWRAIFKRK